jgi:hypothetical protein
MVSVLSLLTGVVMIGLVYGLSLLPTATLTRHDDIALADDDSVLPGPEDAGAPADPQENAVRERDTS